jgi:hypothetical protein
LLSLHQLSMISLVSVLPYYLGSPYLVNTMIVEGTCLPGI